MKILEKIIDLIYPQRCFVCHGISKSDKDSGYVCIKCMKKLIEVKEPFCLCCGKPISSFDTALCYDCRKPKRYFTQGAALYVYNDVMKASIHMFKEKGRTEYAAYYAWGLFKKYRELYRQWKPDCLIPVPLSKVKLKKRGFNQAELIAKELAKALKLPLRTDLLMKQEGLEQKALSSYEREKNSKKAFILSENIVQSKSVLIVDDVFTTGNTINYIAKLLKNSGCESVYFTTVCIGSEADGR